MSKHTPGPWKLCHHLESLKKDSSCSCGFPGDIWGDDGEHVVCGIGPHCFGSNKQVLPRYERDVELANARLIAAAPEMFQTLKGVSEALERMIEKHDPDTIESEWLIHSSEAIDKAEGKQ